MKKILIVALLLLVCAVSVASAKNIAIQNNTGVVVAEIYLSHSGTDDWENDVLGDKVLNPGEALPVDISGHALWDIKMVGENGAEAVFLEIDFNKYSTIILNKNGNATGK